MDWRLDWKLQRHEVEKLIYLYKQNKCLWDYRSPEYKRNDLKREAWQNLAAIFNQEIDVVKRKMKHLRSAYVTEKRKVEEYLGIVPAYKPNLFYYEDMSFLDPIIVLRKQPTFEKFEKFESAFVSQDGYVEDDSEDRFNEEHMMEDDEVPLPDQPVSPNPTHSDSFHKTKAKRQKLAPYYSKLNTAVKTLAEAAKTASEDSIYMAFGKTIALQLSELSPLDATIAMAEMHKILSKNIIKSMSRRNSTGKKVSTVSIDEQAELSLSALLEGIESNIDADN